MTPDETDQYDLTDDNKGQRTIAVRAWENYRRDLNITLSLPNIPSGGRGGDDRVMIQDYDQIGLAVLDVSARYFSPTGEAGGRDHIVSAMHRDIALWSVTAQSTHGPFSQACIITMLGSNRRKGQAEPVSVRFS